MNSFESFDYSSWKQSNSIACGRDILLDFRFYFVNRNHRYTFLRTVSFNLSVLCRITENYGMYEYLCVRVSMRVKREKGDNNLTQQRYAIWHNNTLGHRYQYV